MVGCSHVLRIFWVFYMTTLTFGIDDERMGERENHPSQAGRNYLTRVGATVVDGMAKSSTTGRESRESRIERD
jgi:hypothetical protein